MTLSDALISRDGYYRYWLTRAVWGSDPRFRRTCAWIMLNPSTADAESNDPTIWRVIDFSKAWGYQRIVVLNLFALRATDPRTLRGVQDPVGPDNDAHIRYQLTRDAERPSKVVCAWGTGGGFRDRDRIVMDIVRECGFEPLALGVTKGGHPRHPLYMPKASAPSPYTGRP